MAPNLAGWLAVIAAGPDLRRGRCVGQHDLWQAVDDPAAVEAAVAGCRECPVLDRCSDWVDSLPPSKQPFGVTAGKVFNYEPRKRGAAA